MEVIKIGDYGMLSIIKEIDPYVSSSGNKHKRCLCKCDCGNYVSVLEEHIKSGATKSCGCLRKKNKEKCEWHTHIHTRIYKIWSNMLSRCNNPNVPAYKNYGGRGIKVCDEWKQFPNFLKWSMDTGYDDTLTIDRIDNDKGYCPNNCRWVTSITQGNNKRNNRIIEYNGQVLTLSEWARKLGVPYKSLAARIERRWNIKDAFEKPYRKSSKQ